MIIEWPQITWIVLQAMGLGVCIATHGKEQKPVNAWYSIMAVILNVWIAISGGFFG